MLESLTQLGGAGEPEDGSEGGDDVGSDGGGDAMAGLDDGFQQLTLMSSLFSGAQARGMTPAQLQAQLSALGSSGTVGRAGAGDEAQLAQQLLANLGGTEASGAIGAVNAAAAPAGSAAANARVVAQVAGEHGVDPAVAVAMMLVESAGRANAVGDGGTSFGLFQLHEGGMLTAAGLTPTQAFDPRTNATVALKSYAHEWSKGHERRTPGQIAAASQRPADPVGYAAKVDAAMERARALLSS